MASGEELPARSSESHCILCCLQYSIYAKVIVHGWRLGRTPFSPLEYHEKAFRNVGGSVVDDLLQHLHGSSPREIEKPTLIPPTGENRMTARLTERFKLEVSGFKTGQPGVRSPSELVVLNSL